MVEVRIRRDEEGRIVPRCGECPHPPPDMRFKEDIPAYEIWECPECGLVWYARKPRPLRAILVDEISLS